MRVELTKRYQIIGVLVVMTIIFGSFAYELISNPDGPLKAGGRVIKSATQYTKGDAIIPIIAIYTFVLVGSIYYYQNILMGR